VARTDFMRCVLGYRDNSGSVGKASFWVGLDPAVGGIVDMQTIAVGVQTALNACTNAKNVTASGVFASTPDPSQYGTAATYANAEQKARLNFLGNSRVRSTTMQIPAPLVGIFFSGGSGTGGDEETVNPAATPIVNLLAALQATSNSATVTVGPVDEPIHSLVLGKLIRHKNQRKITRWKKDPTGTIPA